MNEINEIIFSNANSRETYFTLHKVKEAHRISQGKGIRVGIIDWLFGKETNSSLYNGFFDVTNCEESFYNQCGHGYWMAIVLKEIAPECEIYAIHGCMYENDKTTFENETSRISYFEKAIDWAINNKIDILTYSHARFSEEFIDRANSAINKATSNGIITTFIHCDNPNNLWPFGCFPFYNAQNFKRNPDFNIYHFDYNQLNLFQYGKYQDLMNKHERIKSGNDLPYFSFSSMSPVLGGFVAILKSIKPNIILNEVRTILNNSTYEITEKGLN